ncbi:MAG: TolC family protein, partial [Rhodoferax sp.]|nr:TolC family protein [Rhodoferax sp.]
ARMAQALVSYRKTILGALGEVANGLTAYDTSTELVGIQRQRVAIAREAMRLAELRFRAGTAGFIEVLDAQRQLLTTETEQAQTVLDQRTALIGLYLALGGGWNAVDVDASKHQKK